MRDQVNEVTGSNPQSLCIPTAHSATISSITNPLATNSINYSTTLTNECNSVLPHHLAPSEIASALAKIITTPAPIPASASASTPTSVPPSTTIKPHSLRSVNDSNVIVRIKPKYIGRILENIVKITALFGVQYIPSPTDCNHSADDERGYKSLLFQCATTDNDIADLCASLQNYIDSLSITEAEDSSYDSECDADDSHEQVSRTTSDTLGQEYADYVSQPSSGRLDKSPSYTQRVEFALKLGYTERLVQAALARLGPNPAQNELLAELIKLGAQQCNKGELCDSTLDYVLTNSQDHNGLKDEDDVARPSLLRPIVIDGSNVAMSHGNKEVYSCLGIKLCVDWFKNRGHRDITVFVPKWRKESCRPDNPIKDQDLLNELEKERLLVFTPSRLVGGKRTVCYDDRYILKLASENDGIVVSNDNYRDLATECTEYKRVIEERVLMFSFVNDRFMPPDDPLGRSGPTLDNFLRIQPKKGDPLPACPYGKKCTYGNKCKFYHPERGGGLQKSVTERLSEHAARHLSARNSDCNGKTAVHGKSLSVPLSSSSQENCSTGDRRKPLARTRSCAHDGCDLNHCLETVNPLRSNTVKPNIPTWEEYCMQQPELQNTFPKSHSKESLSQDSSLPNVGGPHLYAGPPKAPPQCRPTMPHYGHINTNILSTHQQQSQPPPPQQDEVNLHQKLRRQLSLNPTGCDPRLYRIQQQHTNVKTQKIPNAVGSHRPLAPTLSGGPRPHMPNHWDLHQNVTRIASAPDSSRAWQNCPPPSSSSEPHLWLQHSPVPPTATVVSNTTQDHRRHLQYHLSSIFPEEQVQTVMQMYPDETNPQNICAAILSMFPKI